LEQNENEGERGSPLFLKKMTAQYFTTGGA
jgi:hypothetical protein